MGFCCFASLVSMGSPAASAPAGATWRSVHTTAGVLDRLVDRQDETSCFWRRRQGVDPHYGRLPHAGDKVVCDVLVVDVHTVPHAPLTGDGWSAQSHLHFKYYQGLKGVCVFVCFLPVRVSPAVCSGCLWRRSRHCRTAVWGWSPGPWRMLQSGAAVFRGWSSSSPAGTWTAPSLWLLHPLQQSHSRKRVDTVKTLEIKIYQWQWRAKINQTYRKQESETGSQQLKNKLLSPHEALLKLYSCFKSSNQYACNLSSSNYNLTFKYNQMFFPPTCTK